MIFSKIVTRFLGPLPFIVSGLMVSGLMVSFPACGMEEDKDDFFSSVYYKEQQKAMDKYNEKNTKHTSQVPENNRSAENSGVPQEKNDPVYQYLHLQQKEIEQHNKKKIPINKNRKKLFSRIFSNNK